METNKPVSLDEHVKTANEFLEQSERELKGGDKLQASEKLWGAAAHVLTAVMVSRGMRHRTHRDLKEASKLLSVIYKEPALRTGFSIAEKFHSNFYTGIMEDYEIESDKDLVYDFVNRILSNEDLWGS